MLLHTGAGYAVRACDIVGIFDLDGKVTTADTAEFLRRAEHGGALTLAGSDLPKCFLLLAPKKKGKARVILSHLSVAALAGRTQDTHGKAAAANCTEQSDIIRITASEGKGN